MTDEATTIPNGSMGNRPNQAQLLYTALQLSLLVGVTLAAYANAWPDALVLDDKFFAGADRFAGLENIASFFREDVWAAAGTRTGLYRPMLLLSLFLDSRLWGDWMAGYHLSNILLHVLVTLFVFGLIRQLLRMSGSQPSPAGLYALLAALVFAVHPVHLEAVNSIFNRSEVLVALGGVAGLWWLVRYLETRPARAWSGLALAYLFAIFAKESAVVLPALAFVLVFIFAPGRWTERVKKGLPALWLLIPLAFYLLLRVEALAPSPPANFEKPASTSQSSLRPTGDPTDVNIVRKRSGSNDLVPFQRLPNERYLLWAAGLLGQSLRVMLWPDPLKLFYDHPVKTYRWAALVLQGALVAVALLGFARGRPGLIAGLAFFYVAMLPVTRFIGMLGLIPDLAERYLYFPSVGLAIVLAFGFRFLGRRFGLPAALAPVILALLVLTPLCWARNAEWADESGLFESEYRKGSGNVKALEAVTTARLSQRDFAGVIEVCDLHVAMQRRSGMLSNACALAYGAVGRNEEAERAFLFATRQRTGRIRAHNNLATFYLRLGRREEAKKHLELAIKEEHYPELKAYRRGKMIALLYGSDRGRLLEARSHFEEALRLQPGLIPARQWLERLDRVLALPRTVDRLESARQTESQQSSAKGSTEIP